MKLMLRKERILTAGHQAVDCLVPAVEVDLEAFEKLRSNTWYKADLRRPRNGDHHRKGWALINLIFDSQEKYRTKEDLLVELKLKAGWYVEHVRSGPPSQLLCSMQRWCDILPGAIRRKLDGYLMKLRQQEKLVYLPKSISFADMDQTEFEEFYDRVVQIAKDDYDLEDALEFLK